MRGIGRFIRGHALDSVLLGNMIVYSDLHEF